MSAVHGPLTACLALFLAGGVAAQQPTFRASTRLVEVSVVVEDGSGRPVEGLSRSDFTVYEDGVEVPIEIFAPPPARGNTAAPAAGASRRDAVATPREPLTRGDFSNRLGEAVPGVTVVVLDRLNTRFEDQRSVRDDLLKAIAQIRPDDRAAIYVIESDVVRVLHDFTTDTASLLRALSRYQGRTSRQAQATDDTPVALAAGGIGEEDAEFADWLRDSAAAVSDHYLRQRVDLTTRALKAIASRLSGVRGRKNLVWISSAFPLVFRDRFGPQSNAASLNDAARAINNANIAVYAMNARGLVAPYGGAAAKPTQEVNRNAPRSAEADAALVGIWTPSNPQTQPNIDTLESISEATGGRAFNGNDAGKAILRAVGDARLTYVLGYYPVHATWDGAYHSIKVGVKRSGASVRSRKGYFAIPSIAVGPQPAEALLDALRSPLQSTEVGVSAHVERVGAASGKAAGEYTIEILVEPAAITVDKAGEIWKGSLDLLIGESLPEGRYFKTFAANMRLEFTDEQRAQMLRDGLRISRTVAPRAGADRLHVVVRDAPTGTTGSLIIPLQR